MSILLTGGAGYIGSHAAVTLSQAGHQVVILDNFSNSRKEVLISLDKILGRSVPFVEGDIRDTACVQKILKMYGVNSVFHFAGLKAVGESVYRPLDYYSNNIQGTISVIEAMQSMDIKTLVVSSSATVYGYPQYLPIDESHPTSPTNPYGRTKLFSEEILKDVAITNRNWRVACLRYFNPVGAHQSGLIGDFPVDPPDNIMPYLSRVASGKLPLLNIFGSDYDTQDGTGARDYIHISDVVEGHLAALNFLEENNGYHVFNLGRGEATTVLQLKQVFEEISNTNIPSSFVERRLGDVLICFANPSKANIHLRWHAKRNIGEMCDSAWQFSVKSL